MRFNLDLMEPVIANKLGYLKYDRSNKLLVGIFEGYVNIDLFKESFEYVIVYAEKNKIVNAVYDLTAMKGTFTHVNSYISNRLVPALMPLGYKYVGMITNSDPFTKFAVNAMISLTSPKGIDVKIFNSLLDWEKWISEKVQPTEQVKL
jgi:hypothetical protein